MTDTIKKRRYGPLPTGKGTQVVVRLQPPMLAILDQWIAAQPKSVSRPEAFRQMLARVTNQSSES